ncbi:MAG TPA: alkyl sulfatase dimerization domain-containing protein [Myxococcota bacterium]|nr:alkyl sulfatase dimerization domain-containing protein [Myxococcota bacterium]
MATLRELSDRLLSGHADMRDPANHPFAFVDRIEEVAPGVAFYKAFVNVTVIRTAEGLVLVDTGSFHPAQHERSFAAVRRFAKDPVHTAIYTHGHVDHAYGLPPFLREADSERWARPAIVGHVDVAPRMKRYIETAGYNSAINTRQFGVPVEWPRNPDYPTTVYRDDLRLRVGGRELELHHARGETDDHTWVFLPDARALCTGDLFIWAAPNAGNPQKVQRYASDWAEALRAMAAREAQVLLPGHGVPIYGAEQVRKALLDTADYLESLYRQTLELLNRGASVYDIIQVVKPPAALATAPYLQPIYDEPEFIVRNVVRCLGGWYSGVPSELKPAPRAQQARELAELAGGVGPILARAARSLAAGDLRMASHWVDWAIEAEPESREAHALRADVYQRRVEAESSTMSKGIFRAAAQDSAKKLAPG